MVLPGRIAKHPLAPGAVCGEEPVIVSECGGHGFGRYGDPSRGQEESLELVVDQLAAAPHIQGFAYTQFCDTGHERNGLVTLDRRPRIPADRVREILGRLEDQPLP